MPLHSPYLKQLFEFEPYKRIRVVFPHISHEIESRWGAAAMDAYLQGLLLSDRCERNGFPEKALADISEIRELHESLFHEFLHVHEQIDVW